MSRRFGKWWLNLRAGRPLRHATFEERGVAVPGTGRYRGHYGTTWSEPEWNRIYRDRTAMDYETRANDGPDPDDPWEQDSRWAWEDDGGNSNNQV